MKNDRPGEWLWEEWSGDGYELEGKNSIVYVTYEEVDIHHEVVKRALASCLQRDGISDSLSDGFRMVEKAIISSGYVGYTEGEKYPSVTDEFGETINGEETDYLSKATWVEISL
jgi:hypothetical protein